jgi:subtilisin family serine protease
MAAARRFRPPKNLVDESRERWLYRHQQFGVGRRDRLTSRLEQVRVDIARTAEGSEYLYAPSRLVLTGGEPAVQDALRLIPQMRGARTEQLIAGDRCAYVATLEGANALDVTERFTGQVDATVRLSPDVVVFAAQPWIRVKEGENAEPDVRPPGPLKSDRKRGRGVKIAVLDTGFAAEALDDPWLHGVDCASDDVDPLRVHGYGGDLNYLDLAAGHGTFVAGIIRQIAPGARLVSIRVLDSDGLGFDSDIAWGIKRAVAAKADIVNMSLGGYTPGDAEPAATAAAVANAPDPMAFIAAGGNESWKRPCWPAAHARVLGVAGLELDGLDRDSVDSAPLAKWSNEPSLVDAEPFVAAAGRWRSIYVTGKENPLKDPQPDSFSGAAYSGGTSFAAAAISGHIAVRCSAERHSGTTPADIVRGLSGPQRLTSQGGAGITHIDVWA